VVLHFLDQVDVDLLRYNLVKLVVLFHLVKYVLYPLVVKIYLPLVLRLILLSYFSGFLLRCRFETAVELGLLDRTHLGFESPFVNIL
jgi:hypothetical protein